MPDGTLQPRSWRETGVWLDTLDVPVALESTLANADVTTAASLVRRRRATRLVASGNGSSFYAALGLWIASLMTDAVDVIPVPAGVLQAGAFRWRDDDVLLAISSSGELRDLVEAIDRVDRPPAIVTITSTTGSTLARAADAVVPVTVPERRAATHTQDFCAVCLGALHLLAELSSDRLLEAGLHGAPEAYRASTARIADWADDELGELRVPRSALVFGGGCAWPAALEAALLLKELAGVHAEGVELREVIHSAMASLGADDFVVEVPSAPAHASHHVLQTSTTVSGARGITLPLAADSDDRLTPITAFPAILALSLRLAHLRGADPDAPAWVDSYLATVRV